MAGGDAAAQIRELTRGQGAELVLDLVGAGSTLALAAAAVCKLSHLTLVGLAGGSIPFNFFAVPYECSVATTYWGSVPELMEVVSLAEAGRIKSRIETFPLERATEACDLMRAGRLIGRAVIEPVTSAP